MKPRVMVSSVVIGYEEAREAARRGIEDGGGEPLLVNEDFPAMATSPRNACLDAVDSSDIYLVILGSRAGYNAPSGKPVVEEEYERAIGRGLPVLAFVQEGVDREPESDRLIGRISEYVGGNFRSSFVDYTDLRDKVAGAVRHAASQLRSPIMDLNVLNSALVRSHRDRSEPILRTVFAPLRDEELIDAVEIGRESFREQLLSLGMVSNVALFSAWHSKEAKVRGDSLTIRQESGNALPYRYSRLDLNSNGLLSVESNVTGRHDTDRGIGMLGLQILEADIIEVANQHFAFANALYDLADPYHRHHAVHYNCALIGAAHRLLAKEPSSGGAIRMSMRGDEALVVHPQPRQIGRAILADAAPEIDRTLELLKRRMAD